MPLQPSIFPWMRVQVKFLHPSECAMSFS